MQVSFMSGRLTADPILRSTEKGIPVVNFNIAVPKKYQPKGTKPNFFKVTAWRAVAENIEKYIGKGCRVNMVGEFHNTPQEKQGVKYTTNEFTVERIDFLDFKNSNTSDTSGDVPFGAEEEPLMSATEDIMVTNTDDEPMIDISTDDLPF